MPDPDPQPPQPRPVSATRWLLMLLPSMPMLLLPLIADMRTRFPASEASEARIGNMIATFFMGILFAAALSLIMGLLLERWRYGAIKDSYRAVGCGFLILFTNLSISFVGCAVGAATSHP